MKKFVTAAPFLPVKRTLASLAKAAARCKGCDLYKKATQTVFGEGSSNAKILFVGEQPGNAEDLQGHPFVGPAGKMLEKAVIEAGLSPLDVYTTNAVKHFKWERKGKIRLHKKPSVGEVKACRPWLEAEVRLVKPAVVVCLGATAALAVFEKAMKVNENRWKILRSSLSEKTLITVHPSSILRAPDEASRHAAYELFVGDLKKIADEIKGSI